MEFRLTVLAIMGLQREARVLARPGLTPICGGGVAEALEQRIEQAIGAGGVRGLISTGIAGALDPSLKVGDCVIGTGVVTPEARWPADPAWVDALRAVHADATVGEVFGSQVVVLGAADKLRIHQRTGAVAVDMESHVAAQVAARHGLPFAMLRVISDTTAYDLAPAFFVCMRPDGGIDRSAVLRSIARAPAQLPGLLRTLAEVDHALRALGARHAALTTGAGLPTE